MPLSHLKNIRNSYLINTTKKPASAETKQQGTTIQFLDAHSKRRKQTSAIQKDSLNQAHKYSKKYNKLPIMFSNLVVKDNEIILPPLVSLPKHPYHSCFQMLDIDLENDFNFKICPNSHMISTITNTTESSAVSTLLASKLTDYS